MKKQSIKIKKSPQEMQDDIFRKMSADRKIEVASQLWRLARTLIGDKKLWKRKIQGIF